MFFKLINQINKQRNKLIKNRNKKKRNLLISKYREFDSYEPDIIKHEAESIYIKQKLPSEPPQGITYHFCATGYFTKNRNSNYCIIFTEWKNINNYCHWTFVELPLIYLASVLEIVDKDCVYPSHKDGLIIPGKKATRTYFHMVSHMKNLNYACIESDNYYLSIDKLKNKIIDMR